ncbi:hypothetical protein DEV91_11160 [Phyllobacterium brassicacearum]|nr:hypothetical protein DEV91_11160 [Phyllobacterium brassicacearum]
MIQAMSALEGPGISLLQRKQNARRGDAAQVVLANEDQ